MGVEAVLSMAVVVVAAAVASICVAVVEHEARRLHASMERLAAAAGSPSPEGSR